MESGTDIQVGAVAIRTWGQLGRDQFVLLHGAGGNAASWNLVAPRLAESGFVVAVDLRGHGRSAGGDDYAISALAADVVAVMESLGVVNPVVVGHSWGASVAFEVAVRVPCRAIVNVDGNVGSPREVFAGTDLSEPNDTGDGTEVLLSASDFEAAAEAQIAARREQGKAELGQGEIAVVRRNLEPADACFRLRPLARERALRDRGLWEHNLTAVLDALTVPTMFAMSEDTRSGSSLPLATAAVRDRLKRLVTEGPEREIVWIRSGHNVPLEAPAKLVDAVLRFIAAIDDSD